MLLTFNPRLGVYKVMGKLMASMTGVDHIVDQWIFGLCGLLLLILFQLILFNFVF